MKSNYIIRFITWDGEESEIPFRGSPRQADKVFVSLAFALCESIYKYLILDLVTKTSKQSINSVQFRGVESGV